MRTLGSELRRLKFQKLTGMNEEDGRGGERSIRNGDDRTYKTYKIDGDVVVVYDVIGQPWRISGSKAKRNMAQIKKMIERFEVKLLDRKAHVPRPINSNARRPIKQRPIKKQSAQLQHV